MQIDFSKIVKKIDGMVELLKTEGKDDASKKDYCGKEFHEAELKTKSVASTITSLTATVEQSKGAIAQLATEIKGLQAQGLPPRPPLKQKTKRQRTQPVGLWDISNILMSYSILLQSY